MSEDIREKRKKMRWERLSERYGVYTTSEHGFTTDTLLLADFSMPRAGESCADFGTGSGTIPLLWADRAKPRKIFAVEIQQAAYEQAKQSIEKNGAEIELILGDVRERLFPHQSLDMIACNPPYKADGAGLKNPDESKRIARHEDTLTLSELAEAASFALKSGGRLCLCQRPERLTDAMCIMRENRLEPKRLRLVQQRETAKPSLFLLECRRDGKSGMTVEPALIIEDEAGYTQEMKRIYGEYYQAGGYEGD